MPTFEERLQDAGLAQNEARAYACLLQHGSLSAGAVAQKTSLNRTLAYEVLGRLVKKGFASHTAREQVRLFTAAPPERISSWLAEKQERAGTLVMELKKLEAPANVERAEVFQGFEGIRTCIGTMLADGEDWYGIGWTGGVAKRWPSTFEWYEKQRLKAGIKRFVVTTRKEQALLSGLKLTTARFVPKEFLSPASLTIFGDKVLTFMPYRHEPTAILFSSRDAAQTYRQYFRILWRIATK